MSSDTVTQVQRWQHMCLSGQSSHRLCAPYKEDNAYLPTRILDIGDAYSRSPVRLHVPQPGDTARYVALSHCWGGVITTVTTRDNFKDYTNGVSLPLPQTFQDAVWFTRALGIRYLWIDSFCIMQDSLDDWHAQAPQMAAVYGNAYLTLSADAAANSAGGFLEGAQRSFNKPHQVAFNTLGMKGKIYVRERCSRAQHTPVHDWVSYDKDPRLPVNSKSDLQTYSKTTHRMDARVRSPLSKRAWVLQERVLSPRTIHFGHAETGWECHSQSDCECSPLDSMDMSTDRPTLKDAVSRTPWPKVVELFSSLGLTSEEDRLVALSGLAEARQKITEDRYVAGSWLKTIKHDLVWRSVRGLSYVEGEDRNRRLNIAPSWSWASTTAEIHFGSPLLIPRRSEWDDNWESVMQSWKVNSVIDRGTSLNSFGATASADVHSRAPC